MLETLSWSGNSPSSVAVVEVGVVVVGGGVVVVVAVVSLYERAQRR